MTLNMWIAVLAWILLTVGLIKRKERTLHVLLMRLGIVIDIALVLYLQLTREAVQTAAEFSLPVMEQVHIGFSTLALLLYFPVLFLGWQLGKESVPAKRILHIRLGLTAYVCRTLGFLFMFSMIQ
jgi:hypothetical protein